MPNSTDQHISFAKNLLQNFQRLLPWGISWGFFLKFLSEIFRAYFSDFFQGLFPQRFVILPDSPPETLQEIFIGIYPISRGIFPEIPEVSSRILRKFPQEWKSSRNSFHRFYPEYFQRFFPECFYEFFPKLFQAFLPKISIWFLVEFLQEYFSQFF